MKGHYFEKILTYDFKNSMKVNIWGTFSKKAIVKKLIEICSFFK